MTGRYVVAACMVVALMSLAGRVNPLTTSWSDPFQTKEAIATREAPAELVFQGELAGEPTMLVVHDCEVQRVERSDEDALQWTRVLAPEFYPFWTVCERQSVSFDAGVLTVHLGRMAIGAGGCCATGGTYRSVNGRTWKKQ